ncbi:MAG: OsmC family protein [Gemmatimonadetes bacterium]|nr:OsmC family protein [Gemmatimonadota bacterium]
MEITLEWRGEERFVATTSTGVEVALDGASGEGVSPMESLLVALAGCMATDVVDILTKGRQQPLACRVLARGERREEPPRRFTTLGLTIELTGADLSRGKVDRAVRLSRETYCSVWHTLARDLDLDIEVELREGESG